ncbi:unnamed protein product, partial [Protopolystoma xenopodis]
MTGGAWNVKAQNYERTTEQNNFSPHGLQINQPFQLMIVAYNEHYEILLNNTKLCDQEHLVPLSDVTHLAIDGEADFRSVEFKDLLGEDEEELTDAGDTEHMAREDSAYTGASARSNGVLPIPVGSSSQVAVRADKRAEAMEAIEPGFIKVDENRRSFNRKPSGSVKLKKGSGMNVGLGTKLSEEHKIPEVALQVKQPMEAKVEMDSTWQNPTVQLDPPMSSMKASLELPNLDETEWRRSLTRGKGEFVIPGEGRELSVDGPNLGVSVLGSGKQGVSVSGDHESSDMTHKRKKESLSSGGGFKLKLPKFGKKLGIGGSGSKEVRAAENVNGNLPKFETEIGVPKTIIKGPDFGERHEIFNKNENEMSIGIKNDAELFKKVPKAGVDLSIDKKKDVQWNEGISGNIEAPQFKTEIGKPDLATGKYKLSGEFQGPDLHGELGTKNDQGKLGIKMPKLGINKPDFQLDSKNSVISAEIPKGHLDSKIEAPTFNAEFPKGDGKFEAGLKTTELNIEEPDINPEIKLRGDHGKFGIKMPKFGINKPDINFGIKKPELASNEKSGQIGASIDSPSFNAEFPSGEARFGANAGIQKPDLHLDSPSF